MLTRIHGRITQLRTNWPAESSPTTANWSNAVKSVRNITFIKANLRYPVLGSALLRSSLSKAS